ncbi:membrane-bound lytic murein transglycosylase MltF [Aromatoleum evansii]|uniref:Membrane-bound lytic murein transglycosylase MltF n=1 Tax=Aromatoleum evansii TaxID=59406 RepID=A0ABZ1AP47_AROEV|nr:membrane-bound lytic murein transglycosylase MltF [Aromatoleum evansii]NMG27401.1 membrane-bound lytic murein transglycosylase MltF [Aromatoleum evansii]WRL47558.1 membrane-bound lytic murein transglycosylase MltF [Aromatoleum evansii]
MRTLLIIATAFLVAGCEPGTRPKLADLHSLADYRSAGELRVATRVGPASYRSDAEGKASGFDHDLLQKLGERLGVPVRFVLFPDATRALEAVIRGQVHLAAAGVGRNDRLPLNWTSPLREIDYVLVGRSDNPELTEEKALARRIVSVRHGSLTADYLTQVRKRVPDMNLHFPSNPADEHLLNELAQGHLDLVATDRVQFALAAQTLPNLAIMYDLPVSSTVGWALPPDAKGGLAAEVEDFLATIRSDDTLARLSDRYFGHIRRLDDTAVTTFLARIQARLPRYRLHFLEAQARTGIDWRFLAALAYQESHWDPLATSWSGVRGMMMLTSETADRLGVRDRLDARESILGGARYFAMLKEQLPDAVPEPDRSWMAAAAYNLGMGHMNGARTIAQRMGKNNTSWLDMKAVLPLMSRPEYASRLKAGAARGGEAVIMAENIRNYHDILLRLEGAYVPPLQPTGLTLGAAPKTPPPGDG